MQKFNLMTWSGGRLVAYEPITASSKSEAVAFAQGILTERTKGETDFLNRVNVWYVIDHGHHALDDLPTEAASGIGSWHIAQEIGGTALLWQPNDADLKTV